MQTRRPPEGSVAAGEIAAREKGEGDRELAPRPLARRAFWGRSPPPRERLLAPQAASGPGIFGEEVPEEGRVNDFLWFEDSLYAEWLGFNSSEQLWQYCDLINKGVNEDELYTNGDDILSESELNPDFELYKSENPDWEEYYDDFEDWALDNGYDKFFRNE